MTESPIKPELDELVNKLFAQYDADQNGWLDKEEFLESIKGVF